MNQIALYKIFRLARETQGILQTKLAEAANITSSAISKYELNKAKLSRETLISMCNMLNINPDFIEQQHPSPFLSNELIKMRLSQKEYTPETDLDPFVFVIFSQRQPEIVFLTMDMYYYGNSVKKPSLDKNKTPVYAIVLKDKDGNHFLFRHEDESSLIEYRETIVERIRSYNRWDNQPSSVRSFPLNVKLKEKIVRWEVQKQDMEQLLRNSTMIESLSEAEKRLITGIRKLNINPDSIDLQEQPQEPSIDKIIATM